MHPATLSLDAGGTFFKSALVLPDGAIARGSLRSTPVNSNAPADEILAAYASVIRSALADASAAGLRLAAIAVSTPGPFDYANATSLMPHKFPSIRGLNLRDALAKHLPETATLPLRFICDAHAFLLGEMRHGNAAGHPNVLAITIGTGLGFAAASNGQILQTPAGGPLITIYTRPCRDATIEDHVSHRGLLHLYQQHLRQAAADNTHPAPEVPDIRSLATLARSAPSVPSALADAPQHGAQTKGSGGDAPAAAR
ncbi:MAG: ROK family protein, partial [Opitutaceae bacterium]|nr:ROK family protein [Opitutaceae bacterium]